MALSDDDSGSKAERLSVLRELNHTHAHASATLHGSAHCHTLDLKCDLLQGDSISCQPSQLIGYINLHCTIERNKL